MNHPPRILVICGPTASGKSDLAIELARAVGGEIVNADSMQVYRGMDIGTAKPSPSQRSLIPHHLLDVADPDRLFSAADYADAADLAIADITARGRRAIVAGGTGLYIRALLQGLVDSPSGAGDVRRRLQEEARRIGNGAMHAKLTLVDPESAARIHPNNLVRVVRALEVFELTGHPLSRYQEQHGFSGQRYRALRIGISVERQELYRRIEARVERMLGEGLVEEVARLLASGYSPELKAMRAIGYKEICMYLAGEITLADAAEMIKRDSRRYAKRQMTWFAAEPETIWLEYPANFASILRHAIEFFDQEE